MRSAAVKRPASYVPPVDSHPYMVTKPNSDTPKYYKTFKAAQALIEKDIAWLRDTWQGLNIQDSVTTCLDLLEQVKALNEFDGGTVAGLCDPYTGMWYRAALVRRQAV
jgi:hypothetical protein